MIALLNFPPSYCPRCGRPLRAALDELHRADWFAGASCRCDRCRLRLGHADGMKLLLLAGERGDMTLYVRPDQVMQ